MEVMKGAGLLWALTLLGVVLSAHALDQGSARVLRQRLTAQSGLSLQAQLKNAEYPFLAGLAVVGANKELVMQCIGTTVSPGIVLFGAHCLFASPEAELKGQLHTYRVLVGRALTGVTMDGSVGVVAIEKVVRYSNYNGHNVGDLVAVYLTKCQPDATRILINDNPDTDAIADKIVLAASWGPSDCDATEGKDAEMSLKLLPVGITLPRSFTCDPSSEGTVGATTEEAFYTVCYQDTSHNWCDSDIGGPTVMRDGGGRPVVTSFIREVVGDAALPETSATRVSQYADWLMARLHEDTCLPRSTDFSGFFSGSTLTQGKMDSEHALTFKNHHAGQIDKQPVTKGVPLLPGMGLIAELHPNEVVSRNMPNLQNGVLKGGNSTAKWGQKLTVAKVEVPVIIDDDSLPLDTQPEYKDTNDEVLMGHTQTVSNGVITGKLLPCCKTPTCSNPCPPELYAFTKLGQPIE